MSAEKSTLLIGIAAPTCAGKTSLLNALYDRLGSEMTVVNFDNYDRFFPGSERLLGERANPTIVNWEDPALFNYQRFIPDLRKLKKGVPIFTLPHSRESELRGESVKTTNPTKFTVVEGIFVLHYPAARNLYNLKYYIDIPKDVMIERRIARSVGSLNPCDQPEYIQGVMVEGTEKFVLPQKEFADKVLDGLRPLDENVGIILADLKNLSTR